MKRDSSNNGSGWVACRDALAEHHNLQIRSTEAMTPPKKTAAKKAASKKSSSKKPPAKGPRALTPTNPVPNKPAPGKPITKPPVAKEVDPSKLSAVDAQKRVGAIYKLERKIQAKRKLHELAKRAAKAAKAALEGAEEALAQEIDEQRFGPGPLYPVGKDGAPHK